MAESQGFSRITVTPDEDEDVVIQAGVVEEADEPDESDAFDELGEFEEEDVSVAEDDAEEPAADLEDEASVRETPPVSAGPVDDYHETTLDDLASTKMSTTQKAVIIVAVLGIIAFVVWYVLAR